MCHGYLPRALVTSLSFQHHNVCFWNAALLQQLVSYPMMGSRLFLHPENHVIANMAVFYCFEIRILCKSRVIGLDPSFSRVLDLSWGNGHSIHIETSPPNHRKWFQDLSDTLEWLCIPNPPPKKNEEFMRKWNMALLVGLHTSSMRQHSSSSSSSSSWSSSSSSSSSAASSRHHIDLTPYTLQ